KMYEFFDSVTFAILDKTKKSDNYIAFEQTFSDMIEENENKGKRKAGYILTSRPFPVCNHFKEITKNNFGFAQGIFSDGTPFEAELWTDNNGEKNLTVVMPVFQKTGTDEKFETNHIVSANVVSFRQKVRAEDYSALHIGMTDDGEEDDFEVIQSYSEYLEKNGIIRFTDYRRNSAVLYSTDVAGNHLAVISTTLGKDDDMIAETDLPFHSFVDAYFS
ncbi:MAG: hypothetical protein ACI4SB_06200, partial [Acutalibacteraceae bacterium]